MSWLLVLELGGLLGGGGRRTGEERRVAWGKGGTARGKRSRKDLEKEEDLGKKFWKKMERSSVLSGELIFSHPRRFLAGLFAILGGAGLASQPDCSKRKLHFVRENTPWAGVGIGSVLQRDLLPEKLNSYTAEVWG